MVQIFIKLVDKENLNELAIIELQGDLETGAGESLSGKLLGDLRYNKEGIPVLVIGHHVLFGKITNLDKPIVVMKRVRTNETMECEIENDELKSEDNLVEVQKISTEYHIQAIIKKKILFNKRPRPIIVGVGDLKKLKN